MNRSCSDGSQELTVPSCVASQRLVIWVVDAVAGSSAWQYLTIDNESNVNLTSEDVSVVCSPPRRWIYAAASTGSIVWSWSNSKAIRCPVTCSCSPMDAETISRCFTGTGMVYGFELPHVNGHHRSQLLPFRKQSPFVGAKRDEARQRNNSRKHNSCTTGLGDCTNR